MAATQAPVTPADRLSFTLFVAAALHAALIFGITFKHLSPGDSPRTLDVTIAYKTADQAPVDADFLAQVNQEASGDEAEAREITTTEMAPFDNPTLDTVQPIAPSTITPNPQFSQKLVITTQGVSTRHVQSKQEKQQPPKPLPQKDKESLDMLSEEIASLQARLDQQKQAYAKRPRVRTLSAVSAKAHYEALYIDTFRREVEIVGTRNFPQQALAEGKFGSVRLLVQIMPDGAVRNIEVRQSSGHQFLDEAAIRSVRMAAPFAPFTAEMRENIDILEIIRTWKFDRKQTLTSGG